MIRLKKALLIILLLTSGLFLSMVLADIFYPVDRRGKVEIRESDFTIHPKEELSKATIRPEQQRKRL